MIRKSLIQSGVNNLKEFGYEHVTTDNILTDTVYKMFFKKMLQDNLGQLESVDEVINHMMEQVYKRMFANPTNVDGGRDTNTVVINNKNN